MKTSKEAKADLFPVKKINQPLLYNCSRWSALPKKKEKEKTKQTSYKSEHFHPKPNLLRLCQM